MSYEATVNLRRRIQSSFSPSLHTANHHFSQSMPIRKKLIRCLTECPTISVACKSDFTPSVHHCCLALSLTPALSAITSKNAYAFINHYSKFYTLLITLSALTTPATAPNVIISCHQYILPPFYHRLCLV